MHGLHFVFDASMCVYVHTFIRHSQDRQAHQFIALVCTCIVCVVERGVA